LLYAAKQEPERIRRLRWATLLVLCISLIVIVLDNTILNVAIPTLAKPTSKGGLGASASELQWIVDAYTIVFAGLLLTAGSLGDRFGRYRALTFGLVVFGAGSLASAFAGSATALIITRSVMGVGGAFIMPSTLSVITNVFVDHEERGKAIGVWAGVSALGIGIGPISGGILLAHFAWGSIFLVNVPIVILGLIGGYFLVPESRDPAAPRLDLLGAGLSIVALAALLWAIIEAPTKGWTSTPIVIAGLVGIALFAVFLLWERRTPSPMLDLTFFRNPRFTVASAAITLTFFALFGSIFLLTQYLQSVLGYSTVKAGAVLLPQAAVLMVLAPQSATLVRRFGNKRVVAGGLTVVALALLLFLQLQADSSTLQVILSTMLLGVGMANVMAPATDSIMGSLPRAKAGVGSAMNDTTRQVGGALGVAILGSILSSRYGARITELLPGASDQVIAQTKDNVGEALAFSRTQGDGRLATQISDAAKDAFVHGLHTSTVVAAAVILIAVVGVILWLPARHRDEVVTEAEPVPVEAMAGGGGS
jgi:EmrB/QacA subfamily drug resistance transporter